MISSTCSTAISDSRPPSGLRALSATGPRLSAERAVDGDLVQRVLEHVEVRERESRRLREINLEAAHERGVCAQERVPGRQSAPTWQLTSHEPSEKTSDIRLRSYLHTQPTSR